MRRSKYLLLFGIIITVLVVFYLWIIDHEVYGNKYYNVFASQSSRIKYKFSDRLNDLNPENFQSISESQAVGIKKSLKIWNYSKCIVLAVVCCGERAEEAYTMIKSAIILTKSNLVIELFTNEELFPYFKSKILGWPENVKKHVRINLHLARYPSGVNDRTWRSLFRECSSIRLFLPSLLQNIDSVIYVDTDVLFLAPIDDFWSHFSLMNSSHMVAVAPEHEDPATGWYNRFARHPYYGKLGVNSGVMLMNLTRLRSFGWEEYLAPIEKEFRSKLAWGDQDIINIIFHYHPDKLFLIGCEYNYRSDHCKYMSICKAVNERGVLAVHGNRKAFHETKQPTFKAIYNAWNKFNFEDDLRQDFYYPLSKYFIKNGTKSNCGKLRKEFLMNIEKQITL